MSKRLGGRYKLAKGNVDKVPDKPGIYVIRNAKGDIRYVGMSTDLKRRIQRHVGQRDIPGGHSFQTRPSQSREEAQHLERSYIQKYKPKHNVLNVLKKK